MDTTHRLSNSHLAIQLLQDRLQDHDLVEMVGTKTWNDEQRAFVVNANAGGMTRENIAKQFKEHFPVAVMNKKFTANSVKYILDEWNKTHYHGGQSVQMNNDSEPVEGSCQYNALNQKMQHLPSNQNFASNMAQIDPCLRSQNSKSHGDSVQSPVGSGMMEPAHQGLGSSGHFEQQQNSLSRLNSSFQAPNNPGMDGNNSGSYTSPHTAHALVNQSSISPEGPLSHRHGASARGNTQNQPDVAPANHDLSPPSIQGNPMSSGAPMSGRVPAGLIREKVRFFDHVVDRGTLDSFRQHLVKEGCPEHMLDGRTRQILDEQRQRHSGLVNQGSTPQTNVQAYGLSSTQLQSSPAVNMGGPGMQRQLAQQSNIQHNQTNSSPQLPTSSRGGHLHPSQIPSAMKEIQQHFRRMEEMGTTREQYAQLIQWHLGSHQHQQSLQGGLNNLEQTLSRTQTVRQQIGNNIEEITNSITNTKEAWDQLMVKRTPTLPAEKPSQSAKKRKKRTETAKREAPSKRARTVGTVTDSIDESRAMSHPSVLTQQSDQGLNVNFNRPAFHMPTVSVNHSAALQGTCGFGSATAPTFQPTQSGSTPCQMHQPKAFQDSSQGSDQSYFGTGVAQRRGSNANYSMAQMSRQTGNSGFQWHRNRQAASQQQAAQEAIRRQVWGQDAALKASQQQRQHGLGQIRPRISGQEALQEGYQNEANGIPQSRAQQAFQADTSKPGAGFFVEMNLADADPYANGTSQFAMNLPSPHSSLTLGAKRSADEDSSIGQELSLNERTKSLNGLPGLPFSYEDFVERRPVGDSEWSEFINFAVDVDSSEAQIERTGNTDIDPTEIEGTILGEAAGNKPGNETSSPDSIAPLITPSSLGTSPPLYLETPPVNSNRPSATAPLAPAEGTLPETSLTRKSKPQRVVPAQYQNTKFEKALMEKDWIPADYNISWHRMAISEFEEEKPQQSNALRESKALGDPIRQAIERRMMHRVPASDEKFIPVSEARKGFTKTASNQSHGGSFDSPTWTQTWLENCHSNDQVEAYDTESRGFCSKVAKQAKADADSFSHVLMEPGHFDYDEDYQNMLDHLGVGQD